MTITLAAQAGYYLKITNIFIRSSAQDATDTKRVLFSEPTGFAEGEQLATYTHTSANRVGAVFHTDLSGIAALQNTTQVVFRLYTYGQPSQWGQVGIGHSGTANGTIDLEFTGDVPLIPEPGTLGVAGVGALLVLLRRRRA